nr:MAG TPA: hypothetical protein [Microviridae sp.]
MAFSYRTPLLVSLMASLPLGVLSPVRMPNIG